MGTSVAVIELSMVIWALIYGKMLDKVANIVQYSNTQSAARYNVRIHSLTKMLDLQQQFRHGRRTFSRMIFEMIDKGLLLNGSAVGQSYWIEFCPQVPQRFDPTSAF